jgi:hypothetical protein
MNIRMWLLARAGVPRMLPGRPPSGAGAPGPEPATPEGGEPKQPLRAVCYSGGGIRAAAFALGGTQGLQRGDPGWYAGVDLVTAVSGGSYLAGSAAMVNHGLSEAERAALPPYTPGSPEDNRLRNHTRFLLGGGQVTAQGVLSILYGLLLNLLPILAGLYVASDALGWALYRAGVLSHDAGRWQVHHSATIALVCAGLAGLGLLLFVVDRQHDVYRPPNVALSRVVRAWSLRLLVLATLSALAVLGVPWALAALSATHASLNVGYQHQAAGFTAVTAGLVGLVKSALGRFRAAVPHGGAPGKVMGMARRTLAPWAGSAIALALLLLAVLIWTGDAAYQGLDRIDLAKVGAAGLVMLGWQACTDINRNSIHPFYKERFSSTFAVRRVGASAEQIPYDQAISFSDYAGDRPKLVVCAAVNTNEEGAAPSGRGCAPFTFDPCHTGISSGLDRGSGTGGDWMRPTAEYERLAGPRLLTLPAAVAVSGAAFSPVMGRATRAPLRLLLGLANVRLGLWLPNPTAADQIEAPAPTARWTAKLRWQWRQPGIPALLREILGRTSLRGRWVYVTDGGHYENLGLVEALRRGATEIVAFDASNDRPGTYAAFGVAVETARADLGVEITPEVRQRSAHAAARPEPAAAGLVRRYTCTYPNGVRASLYLCKLALPAGIADYPDLAGWAAEHPAFPNDSTAQEWYGDRQFEAYRRLGELAADTALDLITSQPAKAPRRPHAKAADARLASAASR